MLLKGYNLHKERVDFTLSDCPVHLSTTLIGLSGRKPSYLIKSSTIVCGDDETGIYEGDLVYEDDVEIGYVVYSSGFKVQRHNGDLKKLVLDEHIKVKEGNIASAKVACLNSSRTNVMDFQYDGNKVTVGMFLTKIDDYVVIKSKKKVKLIDTDRLLFFTGLSDKDGNQLYFKQVYNGGIIVLHDLEPMLKRNGDYFKLVDIIK